MLAYEATPAPLQAAPRCWLDSNLTCRSLSRDYQVTHRQDPVSVVDAQGHVLTHGGEHDGCGLTAVCNVALIHTYCFGMDHAG